MPDPARAADLPGELLSAYAKGARDITIAPGTYRIDIDGVGYLDPVTNGYSDYGSIGGYTLSVSPLGNFVGLAPGRVLESRYGAPSTVDGQA